jgi:hypothetical protein
MNIKELLLTDEELENIDYMVDYNENPPTSRGIDRHLKKAVAKAQLQKLIDRGDIYMCPSHGNGLVYLENSLKILGSFIPLSEAIKDSSE